MKKISGGSTNVYVGQRIKTRRRTLGYTLDDIAIKTGISTQMCSKYERGVVQIPPYALLIISSVLSIPVDLLFPENPHSLSSKLVRAPTSSPQSAIVMETDVYNKKETVDLVEAFYRLPTAELRKMVRALVRTVAAELPRVNAIPGPD